MTSFRGQLFTATLRDQRLDQTIAPILRGRNPMEFRPEIGAS